MNLIPFGLTAHNTTLVDVSEVKGGSACNCICPSCKSPLIARHGCINEWHFAHDPAYKSEEAYQACDFSFMVSLRLMIKQLIAEGNSLYTPHYYLKPPISGKKICITTAQKIRYHTTGIEITEHNATNGTEHFDAKLSVGSAYLHVFISYPGRVLQLPKVLSAYTGIIEIDLTNFSFDNRKGDNAASCKQQLSIMLNTPHRCKAWRYHLRETKIKEQLKQQTEQHQARIQQKIKQRSEQTQQIQRQRHALPEHSSSDSQQRYSLPTIKPQKQQKQQKQQPKIPQNWHCELCKIDYAGTTTGPNPCPQCNSHLYRIMR
jgi:Competence protein CoiA-like family